MTTAWTHTPSSTWKTRIRSGSVFPLGERTYTNEAKKKRKRKIETYRLAPPRHVIVDDLPTRIARRRARERKHHGRKALVRVGVATALGARDDGLVPAPFRPLRILALALPRALLLLRSLLPGQNPINTNHR
jgi:hypothetical protein